MLASGAMPKIGSLMLVSPALSFRSNGSLPETAKSADSSKKDQHAEDAKESNFKSPSSIVSTLTDALGFFKRSKSKAASSWMLHVRIVEAKNLPAMNLLGKSDPLVTLKIGKNGKIIFYYFYTI